MYANCGKTVGKLYLNYSETVPKRWKILTRYWMLDTRYSKEKMGPR
jgi:hypothetical protein